MERVLHRYRPKLRPTMMRMETETRMRMRMGLRSPSLPRRRRLVLLLELWILGSQSIGTRMRSPRWSVIFLGPSFISLSLEVADPQMFVFGEVQDPLPETVKLVEDIVRGQIIEIVSIADIAADSR